MEESEYYLRLEKFANTKGYRSINSFALKALKYKSSEKLNRLKKEGNKPSLDVLIDVSNIFEDFNIHWYVTGKGEMLLNETNKQKSTTQNKESLEINKRFEKLDKKIDTIKIDILEFVEKNINEAISNFKP